jgi:hypothetical protein
MTAQHQELYAYLNNGDKSKVLERYHEIGHSC